MEKEELIDFIDNLVKIKIDEETGRNIPVSPTISITPDTMAQILDRLHIDIRSSQSRDSFEIRISDTITGYSKILIDRF